MQLQVTEGFLMTVKNFVVMFIAASINPKQAWRALKNIIYIEALNCTVMSFWLPFQIKIKFSNMITHGL